MKDTNEIIDYDKEIIHFLKRNRNQLFSARELAVFFRVAEYKIHKKLRMLEKYGIVESRQIDMKLAKKLYGNNIDRGLKLYSIAEED